MPTEQQFSGNLEDIPLKTGLLRYCADLSFSFPRQLMHAFKGIHITSHEVMGDPRLK